MTENNRSLVTRVPFKPGVDIPSERAKATFNGLVQLAKDQFSETNLTSGDRIEVTDLNAIRSFYAQAATISPEVFNISTQEHLVLVGRYARLIGSHMNQFGFTFNLNELEALGLLHDVGRTFSHRRRRNDLIGDRILIKAGIGDRFFDKMLVDEQYWEPALVSGQPNFDATEEKISNIATPTETFPERGIVDLADILGKVIDGKIIKWSDVLEISLKNRLAPPDERSMWPSEFMRQSFQYPHINTAVALYYERLGNWFKLKTGINMENVVLEMKQSLQETPLKGFTN